MMARRFKNMRALLTPLIHLLLATFAAATLEACLCADCFRHTDGSVDAGEDSDGGGLPDRRIVSMDGGMGLDPGCQPGPMMMIVCHTPPDGGMPRDGGNPAIPLPTSGSAATLTKDDAVGLFITHY